MRDDPLAGKNILTEEDLYGRTLMVGGGFPPALKAVQQRLIASGKIEYFNSAAVSLHGRLLTAKRVFHVFCAPIKTTQGRSWRNSSPP